ncbi:MAG TPA: hypothetical protein VMH79_14940 [Thermoanaerobaculia bacterium]|nr:hypothetical protein [Thermoanaerobaculia bacterium]
MDIGADCRVGAGLILLVAAGACSHGHSKPVIESGKDFPCRSAISLDGEPSPVEVVAMIGEPLERRRIGGGEVFHYAVRGRYGDHVRLFGLVPVSEPHYFWSCDVRLEFRDGHLYAITHARESLGPDGAERDGPTTRVVAPPAPGR